MYAADQAHLQPFAPYVEAQSANGKWVRVIDDLGFPAGGARTMTADLTGKLPQSTRRIRFTTNLQIYWDNILISRTNQAQTARLTSVPLARADLSFHGFPLKIENQPPGNVKYIYEKVSATGPYTRPAGAYTRYGDVRTLLNASDDKFAVFGSGDEVALDSIRARCLPSRKDGCAIISLPLTATKKIWIFTPIAETLLTRCRSATWEPIHILASRFPRTSNTSITFSNTTRDSCRGMKQAGTRSDIPTSADTGLGSLAGPQVLRPAITHC